MPLKDYGPVKDMYSDLIGRIHSGNREALEILMKKVQGPVFALCLRMSASHEDAEDAAQEILIKIMTRIGSFRGSGTFEGWVYRVARNHLLSEHRSRRPPNISFSLFEDRIVPKEGFTWKNSIPEAEKNLLALHLRISCMMGLLVCLKAENRMAYVLSDVCGFSGDFAGHIMELTPSAYRQKVSRARRRLLGFMQNNCTLIREDNPCACHRQAARTLEEGRTVSSVPIQGRVSCAAKNAEFIREKLKGLDEIRQMAWLFRRLPSVYPAKRLSKVIQGVISETSQTIFNQIYKEIDTDV